MLSNFILDNNSIEINNIDKLIEYTNKSIRVVINKESYYLLGNDFLLINSNNDNKSIKFSGNLYSLRKKGFNSESFIKRLIK